MSPSLPHPSHRPPTTPSAQQPDLSHDTVARRRWWYDAELTELHRLLIASPWERYRRDRDAAAEGDTVEPRGRRPRAS